jgi:membrane-associated protease RseP (regulator of RpoE activity)
MLRRLLPSVVVLALLSAAAGATLAALSTGDGEGDATGTQRAERASVTPTPTTGREEDKDDLQDDLRERIRDLPLTPFLPERPYVGIALAQEDGDVVIGAVAPGSPAEDAGLEGGDVIEAVDGAPVETRLDVSRRVFQSEPGDTLVFGIRRGARELEIRVEVGERPLLGALGERVDLAPRPEDVFNLPLSALEALAGAPYERLIEGELTYVDEDGRRVTVRLVAGTIAAVSDQRVEVDPNDEAESEGPNVEFDITDETRIRRVLRSVEPDKLRLRDRVLVVSQDGEALWIYALPQADNTRPR